MEVGSVSRRLVLSHTRLLLSPESTYWFFSRDWCLLVRHSYSWLLLAKWCALFPDLVGQNVTRWLALTFSYHNIHIFRRFVHESTSVGASQMTDLICFDRTEYSGIALVRNLRKLITQHGVVKSMQRSFRVLMQQAFDFLGLPGVKLTLD